METLTIRLLELIDPPHTNLISGRDVGEQYAIQKDVINQLSTGAHLVIEIDDSIRAINDSFIKGFFSEIFKKYHSYDVVTSIVTIEGSSDFKTLFDKNFKLLDIIYNV